jgi:condensin complex subunit 1
MYAPLQDKAARVQKNALLVLTHLILNERIKAKGQIAEMAKCIVSEDERIAQLSKLFFSELAEKDKAIYSYLPDIISGLSADHANVEESVFNDVMKFILAFVQKVFFALWKSLSHPLTCKLGQTERGGH